MLTKPRIILLLVSALILVAAFCWLRIVFAARYTSTHNITSSSQMGSLHDLLIGSVSIVGFAASAISFWRHPAAAHVVRAVVAIFSAIGVAMTAQGLFQLFTTPGSFAGSSLRPVPVTSGLLLLLGYFAVSCATALPIISVSSVLRLGLYLHFGILPAALFAIFILGIPHDYYYCLMSFGLYLIAGTAFALLNFRMYDLRKIFNRDA